MSAANIVDSMAQSLVCSSAGQSLLSSDELSAVVVSVVVVVDVI